MLRGMDLSTRARRRIATALALLLAVESVSAVTVAAANVPMVQATNVAPAAVTTTLASLRAAARPVPPAIVRLPAPAAPAVALPPSAAEVIAPAVTRAPERHPLPEGLPKAVSAPKAPAPAASRGSEPKASSTKQAPRPASKPASTRRSGATAPNYQGTNHVWIPSLGISRSVSFFPCDRQRAPDNYMYRWGCAGSNNVYLMGHAWGVMKPLHDAYVSGRLHKGMKAWYADGSGRVHVYAVRWWRLTRPTTDAAWAWAAQSVPSMTLQTCVGRNSEFRLMVRLVRVDG